VHNILGHQLPQQPVAQNGTGYGGDAASDIKSRAAGKKRAEKQENQLAIRQQRELQKALKTLIDTAPSEALLSTMKQVMRNQIPSEWTKRRKLYENVLEAARLVAGHHARLLGDKDDDDSLIAALHDFSQHAELISKHDEVTPGATDSRNKRCRHKSGLSCHFKTRTICHGFSGTLSTRAASSSF
jgi:hypothetical protein